MKKNKSDLNIKLHQNLFIKWMGMVLIGLLISLLIGLMISYKNLLYFKTSQQSVIDAQQNREILVSRFSNALNNNDLLNELFVVTGNNKYLLQKTENAKIIRNDFDSIVEYCKRNGHIGSLLDTSEYYLNLYLEILIPTIDSVSNNFTAGEVNKFNLHRIKIYPDSLSITQEEFAFNSRLDLNEYQSQNVQKIKLVLFGFINKIISNFRTNTNNYLGQLQENISRYTTIFRILVISSLVAFALILLLFIYLLFIPIERPAPVLQKISGREFSAINKNFEREFIQSLYAAKDYIGKYSRYVLVFPKKKFFPIEIITGLQSFCEEQHKECMIIDKGNRTNPAKDDLYIILDDNSLVEFLSICEKTNFEFGKDIGMISYGDSPIKKVIAGGITVIDFEMEQHDLEKAQNKTEKPADTTIKFIERGSA